MSSDRMLALSRAITGPRSYSSSTRWIQISLSATPAEITAFMHPAAEHAVTAKRRQRPWVDVQNPSGVTRQGLRPELPQVPGQDDQFDSMCDHGLGQTFISSVRIGLGRNTERRQAGLGRR